MKRYKMQVYYIAYDYGFANSRLEYQAGPFSTYIDALDEMEKMLAGDQDNRLNIFTKVIDGLEMQ